MFCHMMFQTYPSPANQVSTGMYVKRVSDKFIYFCVSYEHLCFLNCNLDLNMFPQVLQGREIPSKCFASMWSLIATHCPSFPQILHILDFSFLFGKVLLLFSIIDFTFSSNSPKSVASVGIIILWSSNFELGISSLKAILVELSRVMSYFDFSCLFCSVPFFLLLFGWLPTSPDSFSWCYRLVPSIPWTQILQQ